MKVAPKVYVPIPTALTSAGAPGTPLVCGSCEFELCEGPDKTIFFECRHEDCSSGAGLREFPADYLYVPEDIQEDMRLHAALWHSK